MKYVLFMHLIVVQSGKAHYRANEARVATDSNYAKQAKKLASFNKVRFVARRIDRNAAANEGAQRSLAELVRILSDETEYPSLKVKAASKIRSGFSDAYISETDVGWFRDGFIAFLLRTRTPSNFKLSMSAFSFLRKYRSKKAR